MRWQNSDTHTAGGEAYTIINRLRITKTCKKPKRGLKKNTARAAALKNYLVCLVIAR